MNGDGGTGGDGGGGAFGETTTATGTFPERSGDCAVAPMSQAAPLALILLAAALFTRRRG